MRTVRCQRCGGSYWATCTFCDIKGMVVGPPIDVWEWFRIAQQAGLMSNPYMQKAWGGMTGGIGQTVPWTTSGQQAPWITATTTTGGRVEWPSQTSDNTNFIAPKRKRWWNPFWWNPFS